GVGAGLAAGCWAGPPFRADATAGRERGAFKECAAAGGDEAEAGDVVRGRVMSAARVAAASIRIFAMRISSVVEKARDQSRI
ncbi:hypothetical protein, partial [Actinoplanes sp. TFC3]|uniref:hypothetical protein n=1 Tax=Actinoplanes sp. TFC3 TaxID=1710355 RepID=UPI001F3CBB6B